jgi:hypothetical protein
MLKILSYWVVQITSNEISFLSKASQEPENLIDKKVASIQSSG